MNWYLAALKKYAVFQGRARRKEYWYFFLFNLIVSILLGILDGMLGMFDALAGIGLLQAVYSLGVVVPALAVSVRRLHDTDRSGWWILIGLIPVIGTIWFIVLTVLDGQPEENRYGADPKLGDA